MFGVTPAQLRVIRMIEANTPRRCSSRTMSEARAWISKHMDESKAARAEKARQEDELADLAAEIELDSRKDW